MQVVPRPDCEKHCPALSSPEVSTYKSCKGIGLVTETLKKSPNFICKETELEKFVILHQVTLY